jgi:hypothetical protein
MSHTELVRKAFAMPASSKSRFDCWQLLLFNLRLPLGQDR